MKKTNKSEELWCHADVRITDRTLSKYLEVTRIAGVLTIECSEYVVLPKLRYTKGLVIVTGSNVSLPNCDEVAGDIIAQNLTVLNIGGKGEGAKNVVLSEAARLTMPHCEAIDSLWMKLGSTATLSALKCIYDVLKMEDAKLTLDVCEHIGGNVEANDSAIDLPVCLEVTRNAVANGTSVIDMPQCRKVGGRVYADPEARINLSPASQQSINKAAFSEGNIRFDATIDYKALSALCNVDNIGIF